MNPMKVDMIKFLMSMFDVHSKASDGIRIFKSNVDELVRRGQIPNEVRIIVYEMYGIMNTDTYKPQANADKCFQINWLMLELDKAVNNPTELSQWAEKLNKWVQSKTILKSARDVLFKIYDLDEVSDYGEADDEALVDSFIQKASLLEIRREKEQQDVMNSIRKSSGTSTVSGKSDATSSVKADIAKIKPEKLGEVYYEYDNPNYTGCSDSSRHAHTKLINATNKPRGAKLVYKREYGDPCHPCVSYDPIPNSWLKPKKVEKKVEPVTRVSTPSSSSISGDPCLTGGGFYSRHC